jgi:hypothetical protein
VPGLLGLYGILTAARGYLRLFQSLESKKEQKALFFQLRPIRHFVLTVGRACGNFSRL